MSARLDKLDQRLKKVEDLLTWKDFKLIAVKTVEELEEFSQKLKETCYFKKVVMKIKSCTYVHSILLMCKTHPCWHALICSLKVMHSL